jgi:monoamine oxidase
MHTDILIVGCGLSGLALADALQQMDVDFQLVEARDRLGGRIKVADVDGAKFDLGPAWFWPGQPRMAAAATRFGLTVFEQYSAGDIVAEDQNGMVRRGAGFASMAGSLRLDGGMGALVDAYQAALPADRLHLGQRITAITQTEAGITATAQDVTITTQTVVLATPPRIAAQIAFDPALPDAQTHAMNDIPTWMAGHAKYIGVYDRPVWRDAGLSGDAQSRRGPMVEIHDASPHSGGPSAVFGFIGFDAQTRATHTDDMHAMAKDQLTRLFGSLPDQLIFQDWAQQGDTATPADFTPTGHPAYGRPPALQRIWDGNVILGSSEMGKTFGGFLEGALEAAQDVASQIVGNR